MVFPRKSVVFSRKSRCSAAPLPPKAPSMGGLPAAALGTRTAAAKKVGQ